MSARVAWLTQRIYRDPLRFAAAIRRLRAEVARVRRGKSRKLAFSSGRYFLDLYAPGWPSQAFDRYVERELARLDPLLGRPPALQTVVFAITRRCGLRCEHCCEWNVLNRPEALSTDALCEIARRLKERGVTQLFVSGGEPLLRFDDLLSVTAALCAQTDVWVHSSGRGLTGDKASRLRDAGLTGMALSLDHWDAQAHDRFRGVEGSFEAVERAAMHVHRAGLLLSLSLCPTRAFVSSDNLRRYALKARSLGASFILILEPKPVGHYAGRDVALDIAQQRELERFSEYMNLDPAMRRFPSVTYLDWGSRMYGCTGAGDRHLYIDTEGAMHACPFCRTPGVHRVDESFEEGIARLKESGCPARQAREALGNTCPAA
jgi:MoaA/NifB/PqqE/SkfB family radical SAM enzyme